MQFPWGLDEPLKRTEDGRIDIGGQVIDFLSAIQKYGLWEGAKMQVEDARLHSQVMAWRSRWLPVSNNASIEIQAPEPEPELEKPKQLRELPKPEPHRAAVENKPAGRTPKMLSEELKTKLADADGYLRPEETARVLGISKATLHRNKPRYKSLRQSDSGCFLVKSVLEQRNNMKKMKKK